MGTRQSSIDRTKAPLASGRAATIALFLALAAIATGGILWFVFGGRGVAKLPAGPPSEKPVRFSRGAGEMTPVSHDAAVQKESAAAEPLENVAAPGRSVWRGRVLTATGEPISGAIVRHLAVDTEAIRAVENDGFLVAAALVPDHFEPGRLRDALAAARHAVTSEDGTYEMTLSSPVTGQLLAWAPGQSLVRRALGDGEAADLDFTLGPAAAIRGTVRDEATGEPAPYMSVLAAEVDPQASSMIASMVPEGAARSRSGADGRYELVGLPPGERRVVPRTGPSDYVGIPIRQGREVVGKAGETVPDVDFTVTRGGRVRGTVADGSGASLPGVAITAIGGDALSASMRGDLEPYAIANETKTKTNADGRFEIKGLPLGRPYAVLASTDGFAPARAEVGTLSAEAPEADVEIALGHGSDVSGIVFDAAGAPSPGTKLSITPGMSGLLGGNALAIASAGKNKDVKSDEAGRFAFVNLPAGEYSIRAGEVNPYDTFDQAGLGVSVTVDGVAPKDGVEVRVGPAKETGGVGVIAGVVKDDRGDPIEGATVKVDAEGAGLFSFLGSGGGATATSKPDGLFGAKGLDSTKTFKLEASCAGHAAASLTAVSPGGPPLEIVLTRSASVSGIVVTADGAQAPVPFTVWIEPAEAASTAQAFKDMMPNALGKKSERSAEGGAGGTFSITDIPPGLVVVVAEVPGYAPARSNSIGLAPGDSVTGLAIRVSAGAALRGLVTVADGSPVRKATVTLRPVGENDKTDALRRMMPNFARKGARDATTGEDGRYEIAHLAPGRYALVAEHAEYAPSRETKVFLEEDEIEAAPPIVMSAGGTIDGIALDKGKGRPGLLVQVMGDGPLQMTSTDAEGKFLVDRLPPGGYLINVIDAGAMTAGKGMKIKSKPVDVVADGATHVEFSFGIGAKVHGRVSGGGPASALGMQVVTLRRPGGPNPEELDPLEFSGQMDSAKYQAGVAIVGADGTYVIEDIEPGKYILELPVLPSDPLDFEGYSKLDRTPKFRRELTVEAKDLEVDIFVP